MRIAIMQPTYLPWLGYFNLMAQADAFVFLDDVAFSRQSWQQRNRIIQDERLLWLTVPVLTSGRFSQSIAQVEVQDNLPWRRKHLASISAAYGRAPFGATVISLVSDVLEMKQPLLAQINIALITRIAELLEISCSIRLASELDCAGGRSGRLLAMCRTLDGTSYLSPAGAEEYLKTDGVFTDAAFPVQIQRFTPALYRSSAALQDGVFPSVIDALAWIGPQATRALIEQEV